MSSLRLNIYWSEKLIGFTYAISSVFGSRWGPHEFGKKEQPKKQLRKSRRVETSKKTQVCQKSLFICLWIEIKFHWIFNCLCRLANLRHFWRVMDEWRAKFFKRTTNFDCSNDIEKNSPRGSKSEKVNLEIGKTQKRNSFFTNCFHFSGLCELCSPGQEKSFVDCAASIVILRFFGTWSRNSVPRCSISAPLTSRWLISPSH